MADARTALLGEILGLRSCVSALARELLLRQGSEVFVHAEDQAKRFAESASQIGGGITDAMRERAVQTVAEVFRSADGV